MYRVLDEISRRPQIYEIYSPKDLWDDPHISKMLLSCHLNMDIDMASRNIKFIDSSVKWLFNKFNLRDRSICDFGCGPGLYTSRLSKLGVDVTGVDISKNSIKYAREYAKREGLKINYINRDYLHWFPEEKFDLVTMIYCDFCSLSPNQRSIMLQKFKNCLKPGGHIVLDVYSEESFKYVKECSYYEKNMHKGFWSNKHYFGFTNSFKYESDKVSLDKYTIVEKDSIRYLYNWLQYYTVETLEKEFKINGLSKTTIYSDVAGNTYDARSKEIAIVASL